MNPAERQAEALEALVRLGEASRAAAASLAADEREAERKRYLGGSRSEPKRLDFLSFARVVPGLAAVFSRKIPPEFWSEDTGTAVIACPCGSTATTELGAPRFCGGSAWVDEGRERDDEIDGCGRAYLYDGANVRVAFSPAAPAAA